MVSKVTEAISDDFKKYNAEFINAAVHVKKFADKTLIGQIILNVGFIVLGIFMLSTNFKNSEIIFFVFIFIASRLISHIKYILLT